MTISFQGLPGAYSDLACRNAYPEMKTLPCLSFEAAIDAVRDGTAALGMLPCENSLAGRVSDIHHLLPDSGLFIIGERFQRVEHCLLAVKGATIAGLRRAHSHSVALGQVRRILADLHLQAVVEADTAGSAKLVAEWGRKEDAAIASALAAEIYGLEILQHNVEDAAHNTTRFYVVAPQPAEFDPATPDLMTTFVFRVRNVPAALYKALGRLRHQRRQHDQAGKLHDGRRVYRHPVPVRRRGPPRTARAAPGPGGTVVLLDRTARAGRLSDGGVPPRPGHRQMIRVEARPGWHLVVLNRPAKLNALTTEMITQLLAAIDAAEADPACRAVVLTGEGRGFCAGQEIGTDFMPGPHGPPDLQALADRFHHQVVRRIRASPLPFIAAVNGVGRPAPAPASRWPPTSSSPPAPPASSRRSSASAWCPTAAPASS